MKRVMVFGTFDHLHRGHRYFLRESAKTGDYLTAVVAVDSYVKSFKDKKPHKTWKQREELLLKKGLVDQVCPSDYPVGQWQIIEKERPDIVCLGHDQKAMEESLLKWLEKRTDGYHPQIKKIEAYKRSKYSSSRITELRRLAFYGMLVISMLIWGLSWVSAKVATHGASSEYLLFWRFLFSSVAFIPLAIQERRKSPKSSGMFHWTLISSLLLLVYNYLFFQGLRGSMAGKGGVIVTTLIPLFTLLLSMLLLKQFPRTLQWLGLLLGLGGGFLLMEPWAYTMSQFLESSNLLFVGAGLTWALLTLTSRKAQQKEGQFYRFNFLLYGIATLLSLAFAFLSGVNPLIITKGNINFWLQVAYLGLFAGSLATSIYFKAGHSIGAARASSFTFLVPGSALLFSFFLLDEHPQRWTLFGALLSMVGLLCIHYQKNKTPRIKI